MRRKLIALKQIADIWQYAVAHSEAGKVRLLKAGTISCGGNAPDPELLAQTCGELQFGDRIAVSLSATSALFRWLEFPFREPRKLASATPAEMARLLPESEGRLIRHLPLGEGRVLGLAIRQKDIESLLDQFDDRVAPLGHIGIAPLCYLDALDWPVDSLFLSHDGEDLFLGRIENGTLAALRMLPSTPSEETAEIIRQLRLLSHGCQPSVQRIRLIGFDTGALLAEALHDADYEVDTLQVECEEGPVAAELVPLACLAQGAAVTKPGRINLRSGSYKLRGEWQALRKRLWLAGGLLLLSVALFATSSLLQFEQKSSALDNLQQQLEIKYRKAFPGDKLVAAPQLLLESKLRALQQKAEQSGINRSGTLEILQQVSAAVPADLQVEIREYLFNNDGLRLSGNTTSFDAISRLLASLQMSKHFGEVRMLDSKQALDGNRVDFQLQLKLQKEAG